MKLNVTVSSLCRKSRKHNSQTLFRIRKKLMSAPLSKVLKQKYCIHSMPIRKGDEVWVVRGQFKSNQVGKMVQIYRKKFVVYIEWIQREKTNGTKVYVPVQVPHREAEDRQGSHEEPGPACRRTPRSPFQGQWQVHRGVGGCLSNGLRKLPYVVLERK